MLVFNLHPYIQSLERFKSPDFMFRYWCMFLAYWSLYRDNTTVPKMAPRGTVGLDLSVSSLV